MRKEITSAVALGVALTGCTAEGSNPDVVIPPEDKVIEAPEPVRDEMGCPLPPDRKATDNELAQQLSIRQIELTGDNSETVGYWSLQVEDGCNFINAVEAKVARGDWPYSIAVAEAPVRDDTEFVIFATQSLAPEELFQMPTRTMTAGLVDAYLRSNAEQFVDYELSEDDVSFLTNEIAKAPSFDMPFTYQAPGSGGATIEVATINGKDVGTIMKCMADLELPDTQEHCINTRL